MITAWLESFRPSQYAGVLPIRQFFDTHRPFLVDVLERDGVEVLVACNPDEDDPRFEIFGFLVVERGWDVPVVHYVYVKQAFRKFGVAKALFQAAKIGRQDRILYTCRTQTGQDIIRARSMNTKYDPAILRGERRKDRVA